MIVPLIFSTFSPINLIWFNQASYQSKYRSGVLMLQNWKFEGLAKKKFKSSCDPEKLDWKEGLWLETSLPALIELVQICDYENV